jgi:hypothetical protein
MPEVLLLISRAVWKAEDDSAAAVRKSRHLRAKIEEAQEHLNLLFEGRLTKAEMFKRIERAQHALYLGDQ